MAAEWVQVWRLVELGVLQWKARYLACRKTLIAV
jgi:hypothetical protein